MKLRRLCAALILPVVLALAACGASETEPGLLPEPDTIQPVSVPAEVSVGEAPAQAWTLPTAETQLSLWSGEDIALLAQTQNGAALDHGCCCPERSAPDGSVGRPHLCHAGI